MKRKRYGEEQNIGILKESERLLSLVSEQLISSNNGITPAGSWSRWCGVTRTFHRVISRSMRSDYRVLVQSRVRIWHTTRVVRR